ncbi:MAG: PAS domain S-box protein [Bradyrhizobium sp.]|nr:PAS domain S-box protein [Bradyrhizobium sp.]
MIKTDFQLLAMFDPRLATHATSVHPVWLWSSDGKHILWANPPGTALFGATNATALARKTFGPADQHRRQVAQLASRLPLSGRARMERLRGFGARPGMLMTCRCARLDFPDGSHGVLVTAVEAFARTLPLDDRLKRLAERHEQAVATFAVDGRLVGASPAAHGLLGEIAEADLNAALHHALERGHVELSTAAGQLVMQRLGTAADTGLVALITPPPVAEAAGEPAAVEAAPPPSEHHAPSNEAPTGFALVDEFSEPLDVEAAPVVVAAPNDTKKMQQTPPQHAISPAPRRHPLRFTWLMDEEGRFSLGSDEFTQLIGTRTAAGFGRPWREIAEAFGLDPAGRIEEAVATRQTWSGITLYWPVDGGGRLPVELSGLPVFGQGPGEERVYAGYRGFGVCRDLDSLDHLAELRRIEPSRENVAPLELGSSSLAADNVPAESGQAATAHPPAVADVIPTELPGPSVSIADENAPPTDLDEPVETSPNVVPFRPVGEGKSLGLSPGENHAFNELARQLSARLDPDKPKATEVITGEAIATGDVIEPLVEPPAQTPTVRETVQQTIPEPGTGPEWLAPGEPPARGEAKRDRTLLDLLPTGVLIYRLDRLLYANAAFLQRIGYDSLHALEHAGGVDALYVEAGVSQTSSTSEAGTPVTIAAGEDLPATEGRLFTIEWDGDQALALMFTPTQGAQLPEAVAESPAPPPLPEPVIAAPPLPAIGHANAEDLAAILDTTAEGIVMFDAAGQIHACNRSAEALFGYDGEELVRQNLIELFAPESQRAVAEYLEGVKGAGVASLLDHGRDVLARVAKGGIIPLSATIGRTRAEGPNFFAVFRDLSQNKMGESELQQARRLAERAANAKADMLARISHEVRSPLNAIIGFAEVMMAERFGTLGNERYVEYMKDIRASGERVIAIINDLTDLSRIETGKLDLAFTNQNLNEMVESCVAVMQPHANRERIIIRTSLAHALPPVVADGPALRQITMNLIGNSIHLANPAGQVIVSTALSDFGEVVLRVRDTGPGLNDNEVAAALEPFRTPPPSDQASEASGVSLSLTKALVEANRAQFNLKSAANSGTLVEVVFSRAMARS